MCLGVLLALLLDRRFPGKRLLFSVLLLPIATATALQAVIGTMLFDDAVGIGPALLRIVGVHVVPLSAAWATPTVLLTDVFQWTPLVVLICYSGLQTIPRELYESANLDSAG